jgi:hypothetical protein
MYHYAALLSVLVAAGWVLWARPRRRLWVDHAVAWWLWHWFTGGRLETGRTFPCPDLTRWRCIARRAAVAATRTTAAATVTLAEYLRSAQNPGGPRTLALWAYGGAVVTAVAAVTVAWLAVKAAVYVWWTRPLHKAVHAPAGWVHRGEPTKRAWWYIRVPRAREHGRLGVRVRMAPTFDFTQRNREHIVNIVTTKLDLGEVDHQWRLAGRRSSVRFRPAKRLPELVPFTDSDVRTLMEESTPSAPLLGLGRDGVPVRRDLDTDSPHLLVSAATNGGKSSVLRSVAAQMMWHGAAATVVDLKRHSHLWARRLPNVTYARDVQTINDTLVELAAEADRRNRACDNLTVHDPFPDFDRVVLLCEELNSTMDALNSWWRETRRSRDTNAAPGVIALRSLLFMGRAVRVHVLGVAQQATARSLGGGEARENFAVRILASYSAQTWKMIAPQIDYVPALEHPGWAMVCHGRTATETQCVWLTERDAHEWVAARHGTAPADTDERLPEHDVVDTTGSHDLREGGSTVVDTTDPVALVTLKEAAERGIVTCTLAAVTRARSRDPEFPQPVRLRVGINGGDLFWDEALRRWETNRPRAKRGERHDDLVYFIVVGGQPVYGDQVKIGWTTNLEQRLKAFALHEQDVIRTVIGGRELEGEFHDQWAEHRIWPDREWFYCRGSLADFLGVPDPKRQEVPA